MTQDKLNKAVESLQYINDALQYALNDCEKVNNHMIEYHYNFLANAINLNDDLTQDIKSLLQSDNEGREVVLNGEPLCPECGSLQSGPRGKGINKYCSCCGTKLIWPDNQKKGE